jgi:hypothetical protein
MKIQGLWNRPLEKGDKQVAGLNYLQAVTRR